ncbi:PIR protein [Plasmodium vivax]|nr:PIR protein [Plasmodium vivax]
MAGDQQDPGYLSYDDYHKAKHQFVRTEKSNPNDERFHKIINEINNGSRKWNLNNETFTTLHNVLSNDHALSTAIKPHYCRYINHWLNKEVQNTNNHVDVSYFPIFQKFSDKLSFEKTNRFDQSCKDYFFDIGDGKINKMKFLYNLYDAYNEIKSQPIKERIKTCDNIFLLAKDYRDFIYEYYLNDEDLYNKLENVKESIDKITGIVNSPCTQKIYFTKPPQLVKLLEEKVREAEEREKQKREKEAASLAEEEAAKMLQIERDREDQNLLRSNDLLSTSLNSQLRGVGHENMESHPPSYQAVSRELETTLLQKPTQSFVYSEWPESSTRLLWKEGDTPRGKMAYRMKRMEHENEVIKEQDDKGTTQSGTFFGSSGIPGYITEVFGSVDPVPVVGVSGGMGALFLLFRYTPLGTFFRGGRGRAHRIPRSFNGQFLGAFPDINEYEGGYIGYGPMNIPYGAE